MVTVIIAAKDCQKWLPITLDSLLSQTYKDWECIISVNGSSDQTEEIARSTSSNDKRFRLIVSDIPNKSLAVNRAIIQSKKDWISILDADDLWHPEKLQSQIDFVSNNSHVDILGTQLSYIDELGELLKNSPLLPTAHDECVSWLNNQNNPIANSSVMYKKMLHDRVGYYDPEKFAVEDYDMWMRCMRADMKFKNMENQLLLHRIHKSSSFNSTKKQSICKNLVDETNKFYAALFNSSIKKV